MSTPHHVGAVVPHQFQESLVGAGIKDALPPAFQPLDAVDVVVGFISHVSQYGTFERNRQAGTGRAHEHLEPCELVAGRRLLTTVEGGINGAAESTLRHAGMGRAVQFASQFVNAGAALLAGVLLVVAPVEVERVLVVHLIDHQYWHLEALSIAVALPGVVAVAEAAGHVAGNAFLGIVVVGGLVAVLGDGHGDVFRLILGEADDEVGLAHLLGEVLQGGNLQHGGAGAFFGPYVGRLVVLFLVPLHGGRPLGISIGLEVELSDAAQWRELSYGIAVEVYLGLRDAVVVVVRTGNERGADGCYGQQCREFAKCFSHLVCNLNGE